MTAFSLRARLHLGANSDLALSLPQSSPLYPKRLDSSLLRGSRGGSRRKPQSSPCIAQGSREALSVRLSSFSKYVCGRRPLFGFIHYAARRILRAEIILQIRRHKSGYAESLRRIKALHIPAGDFSRRGSRVAGGKNAFHGLSRPKEHHCAPFPCSIRE